MKIAVTSQNFRTITPHAGRTRRFLVYEANVGAEPVETERLDLPKELSMHDFHGEGTHPLDAVDVVIAGSFGEGFAQRMAARGITAVTTEKTDPVEAVKDYLAALASGVAPAAPVTCGGHGHGHGHGHGEGHGEGHGRGQGLGLGQRHEHAPEHTHAHAHAHRHGHAHGLGGGRILPDEVIVVEQETITAGEEATGEERK